MRVEGRRVGLCEGSEGEREGGGAVHEGVRESDGKSESGGCLSAGS